MKRVFPKNVKTMDPLKKKRRTGDLKDVDNGEVTIQSKCSHHKRIDIDGLVIVFHLLGVHEAIRMRMVCNDWKQIIESNSVWNFYFHLYFDDISGTNSHQILENESQMARKSSYYFDCFRELYEKIPRIISPSKDILNFKGEDGNQDDTLSAKYQRPFLLFDNEEDITLLEFVEMMIGNTTVTTDTHKLAVILAILNADLYIPNVLNDVVKVGYLQKNKRIRLSQFCQRVLQGTESEIIKLGDDELALILSNEQFIKGNVLNSEAQVELRNILRKKIKRYVSSQGDASLGIHKNVNDNNYSENDGDDDGDNDDNDDNDDIKKYEDDEKYVEISYMTSVKEIDIQSEDIEYSDLLKQLNPYCCIAISPNISPRIVDNNLQYVNQVSEPYDFTPFVFFDEMKPKKARIAKERYHSVGYNKLFGNLKDINAYVWETDQRGWAPGFFNASFTWFYTAYFVSIHNRQRNRLYVIKFENGIPVF